MQTLLRRSRYWVLGLAMSGSLLALDACDTTVRDTVLQGVGTAATGLVSTFIQAFIQSLAAPDQNVPTTVHAIDLDAPQVFA
jgi:hypothetical protein